MVWYCTALLLCMYACMCVNVRAYLRTYVYQYLNLRGSISLSASKLCDLYVASRLWEVVS